MNRRQAKKANKKCIKTALPRAVENIRDSFMKCAEILDDNDNWQQFIESSKKIHEESKQRLINIRRESNLLYKKRG